MQALQDAARVGDLAAQPERFTVVVLGGGPFLPGLGDSAEVGEDLRFAEIAEVERDVGQADEHVDPLGGAVDERHLGFGQGAVEIPAHERELGAEQPDAAVF